jgi:cellulose synthase/poly-beta-1,6-N-acetylglucosamine synthase-like glycosyltransferase/CheY-like chemotaxis protein
VAHQVTTVADAGHRGAVLAVDDDEMLLALLEAALSDAGYRVTTAASGEQALDRLAEAVPDVIVSDIEMPELDGFELVRRLREDPSLRTVPLVFLTSRTASEDVVAGIGLGADDYVTKPFQITELIARVNAKSLRPPVPVDTVRTDRRSGLASPEAFLDELARERERAARSGRAGFVAVLGLAERDSVRARFGDRGVDELDARLGEVLAAAVSPLETAGRTPDGRFGLLLPESAPDDVQRRLQALAEQLARAPLSVAGERVSVTPLVGWTALQDGADGAQALQHAAWALDHAAVHLDLRPVRFATAMVPTDPDAPTSTKKKERPFGQRLRTPLQVLLTLAVGWGLPFLLYWLTDRAGFGIAPLAYVLVVLGLLVTGISIYVEGVLALHPYQPPPAPQEQDPAAEHPPVSAVIAAYLPNEAATVAETVEAFLRVEYPGPVQVVLAYNTPRDLPVEAVLRRIAERDDRFLLLRVEGSTSKAQNVNAALSRVTGEFTGVFDADHHPDPDSFVRAWRWLADGYDVVQGHPVVRNGEASWVARMVAVEFETIYAVSHPGRNRLHDFGIFGGSNGYWRTALLRQTRFRGSMLTEDIDSSLRVVEAGYRIGNDPRLVTRELAPTDLKALWNQRMRWAQGWFQVSGRHLWTGWRSPILSARQKLGFTFLLGWRELYPWLSVQIVPIVAFYAVQAGGLRNLDWLVPLFVLTTLFTLSVGPGSTLFAYWKAEPSVRERRRWFWTYLLVSSFFYTEFKNVIARVAQVKELMGEKAWKVTPRAAAPGGRGGDGRADDAARTGS